MSSLTPKKPEDPSDDTPLSPTNYRRRYMLPQGECSYCDRERERAIAAGRHPEATFMPAHDALSSCQSGKHSHCTCDTCF
jgi:hypothetical protein